MKKFFKFGAKILSVIFIAVSIGVSPVSAKTNDARVNLSELSKYMNYVPESGESLQEHNSINILDEITPQIDTSLGLGVESSNNSSNVGAAWAYTSCTSTRINCYGYASRFNVFKNPGFKSGKSLKYGATVSAVANNVLADLKAANRSGRIIASATSTINSNEYRIALRVGSHSGTWDYHFMLQCQDGGWCEKHGQTKSIYDGKINPSTFSWDCGSYKGFYDSSTIYIACTR